MSENNFEIHPTYEVTGMSDNLVADTNAFL